MDIADSTDKTVDALTKLDLPASVDVEIKLQVSEKQQPAPSGCFFAPQLLWLLTDEGQWADIRFPKGIKVSGGCVLGVKTKVKVFRDPVHGDIRVGPLQRVLIDSDAFQRLRYIRQNGLLHYVFPGAVHTRFAHSIGTMHVAQRVFTQLFPPYRSSQPLAHLTVEQIHFGYVGLVFEIAALCHDIGHCAFSHSIENLVPADGEPPLFRSFEYYVNAWREDCPQLGAWWDRHASAAKAHAAANAEEGPNWMEKVKHEELGILFVLASLYTPNAPRAKDTFEYLFKETASFDDFCSDVVAVMRGESWVPVSAFMVRALESCVKTVPNLPGMKNPEDLRSGATQLAEILHELISGTLDVDRFDYLLRDSQYSGSGCGIFDLELLTNSLMLRFMPDTGRLVLCVLERSEKTVDDFLWSRYQLYEQIISHKGNLMLNALFPRAVGPLIGNMIPIPRTLTDFLSLTDDYIMATVRKALLGQEPRNSGSDTAVRSAFLRKRLPRYLGREALTEHEASARQREIAELKKEVSAETGVPMEKINHHETKTELIKLTAPLPRVLRHVHLPKEEATSDQLRAGEYRFGEHGPSFTTRSVHFYTEPERS